MILVLLCSLLCIANCEVTVPKLTMNDGRQIPMVGLGTWQDSGAESYQAVLDAIDAGYRHFDTSPMYLDEPDVGRALKKAISDGKVKREDLFITTKLEQDAHARAKVVPALKQSLSNLQMTYVDLYLVHFPVSNASLVDTWHGMEDAHDQGLAKSIGVSNYHTTEMDTTLAAAKVKPAMNQVLSNPYHHQSQMLTYLKGKNIAMTAYSPLGGENEVSKMIAEPKLVAIGNAHNVSAAQVVLRYQIERNVVVIPKSVTKKYILEDINLFGFKLTDQEIKDVESLCKDNGAFISVIGH